MTETVKHTPGPWFSHVKKAHPGETQIGAGPMDDEGWPEVNVAECFGGLGEGEQESNARLIAASPSLYEYVSRKASEGDEDAARLIANI